jgi:hypothetical protein
MPTPEKPCATGERPPSVEALEGTPVAEEVQVVNNTSPILESRRHRSLARVLTFEVLVEKACEIMAVVWLNGSTWTRAF